MESAFAKLDEIESVVRGSPADQRFELRVSEVYELPEDGRRRQRIVGKAIEVDRSVALYDQAYDHLQRFNRPTGEYELRIAWQSPEGPKARSASVEIALETRPTPRQANPAPPPPPPPAIIAPAEPRPDRLQEMGMQLVERKLNELMNPQEDDDEDDEDEVAEGDDDNEGDDQDDEDDEDEGPRPVAVQIVDSVADRVFEHEDTRAVLGKWVNNHADKVAAEAKLIDAQAEMILAKAQAIREGRGAGTPAPAPVSIKSGRKVNGFQVLEGEAANGGGRKP